MWRDILTVIETGQRQTVRETGIDRHGYQRRKKIIINKTGLI